MDSISLSQLMMARATRGVPVTQSESGGRGAAGIRFKVIEEAKEEFWDR
jgi:hypothetical protein